MNFIISIWIETFSKYEDLFSDVSHQFWICFIRKKSLQLIIWWLFTAHKKNHDINDEWKLFYIEKLLDCCLHHYRHDKQIIKYLIKWIDYESEFNKWYRENFLDNVVEFILEYEVCQNNNLNWINYFHKLFIMNKIEFLSVSINLLLKKQCYKLK